MRRKLSLMWAISEWNKRCLLWAKVLASCRLHKGTSKWQFNWQLPYSNWVPVKVWSRQGPVATIRLATLLHPIKVCCGNFNSSRLPVIVWQRSGNGPVLISCLCRFVFWQRGKKNIKKLLLNPLIAQVGGNVLFNWRYVWLATTTWQRHLFGNCAGLLESGNEEEQQEVAALPSTKPGWWQWAAWQ